MRGQNHAAIIASLPANQHEVSNVDREATPLSDGEHGIASVERVREQHKPASETEPPERDRNGASMGSLAHDPLREEPEREERLAAEADENPRAPDE
jgi:hypothetical protein